MVAGGCHPASVSRIDTPIMSAILDWVQKDFRLSLIETIFWLGKIPFRVLSGILRLYVLCAGQLAKNPGFLRASISSLLQTSSRQTHHKAGDIVASLKKRRIASTAASWPPGPIAA